MVGSDGLIQQQYFIAGEKSTIADLDGYVSEEEELALITMRNIGKFGHPLLREAMNYSQR